MVNGSCLGGIQGEVDGIADPEAHAKMFSFYDFHTLSSINFVLQSVRL